MKIYVITEGEYSGYHIITATIDKEKAEILAEHFSAQIEEFDTDNYEVLSKSNTFYECDKYKNDDNKIRIQEKSVYNWYLREGDLLVREFVSGLSVVVIAENKEKALKIASDKFAKYIAEKEGL